MASQAEPVVVEGMEKPNVGTSSDPDALNTAVCASRLAAEHMPKHCWPEGETSKEVAYRMMKDDDLSLDGNPMLK
jgi:hypothetical protein